MHVRRAISSLAVALLLSAAAPVHGQQAAQADAQADAPLVRQVQQALNQAGYSAGTVDGSLNPATVEALRKFQQAQGLDPSGQLDARTLSALGVRPRDGGADGASEPAPSG